MHKKIYLIFLLIFSCSTVKRTPSSTYGTFPSIPKLDENHSILNELTTKQDIINTIETMSYDAHLCNDHYRGKKHVLDNPNSKNIILKEELAEQILELADCFKISPGILTSLVYKESNFCNFGGTVKQNKLKIKTTIPRLSRTGAYGLTMFTSIAKKDIYDQLYNPDKKFYHFKARPKIHRAMYACGYADLNPQMDAQIYLKKKLWKDDVTYMSHNLTNKQLSSPGQWKKQLLYAAIKLKILLSKRSRPHVFSKQNMASHYKFMLKEYNGAGGNQESNYWQYIFSMYTQLFNPKFIYRTNAEKIIFSTSQWDSSYKKIQKSN
ncbi:MAG: hypothetical protein N4A33_03765 [Bacteriovoracaceae bacterium]|jgi:hypothetical protein|nr:hypothetical protein [Bacteriovoracaceae bacterium]